MTARTAFMLLALLLLKITIVVFLVPNFGGVKDAPYEISKFKDEYDLIAMNVVKGNGYRTNPDTAETMMRPPAYVLLLSGIFYVFGKNLFAVQVVNVLLGLVTILVVRLLCLEFRLGQITTIIAMAIAFLHPAVVLGESRAGIESIFTLSLTLFLLLLAKAIRTNNRVPYILAGATLGFSILIKSLCLLFPPFLCLYLWFRNGTSRLWRDLTNIAIFTITMMVVLAPWTIRNYRLTGSFVPTMTLAGVNAQEGLYVNKNFWTSKERYILAEEAARERNALAAQRGLSFKPRFLPIFYESKDEVYFDRFLFKKTMQEYRKTPVLFLQSAGMNFVRFWFQGRTWSATKLNIGITGPLLLLMIIGACSEKVWRVNDAESIQQVQADEFSQDAKQKTDRSGLLLLLFFIGYFVLVHLPFQGLARYHVPLLPLIAIFAAMPLSAILGRAWGEKREKGAALTVTALNERA